MTPPARRRLFVAVWPPGDLVEQLEALDHPEVRGLRWTTRDQWHVTLRFLGSVEESELAALRESLGEAAGSPLLKRPVEAVAGPSPEVLGNGVWMLPVSGLEGLAAAVDRALDGMVDGTAGAAVAGAVRGLVRPFKGHLTLARAKSPALLRRLPRPVVGSSWRVEEVTLVNSTLNPAGARYDVLDRCEL